MATIINGDGIVTAEGTSTTQGRLRLGEDTDNGSNYVELQAPANVASNVTFTLPSADGTNGQVLQTNGSGTLSFGDKTSLATPLIVTPNATAGAEIRLPEDTDTGSNYVALKAPDSLAANVTFTLPSADGSSGQVLQTNGVGGLSFAHLGAANGGTGRTTLTANNVILGNGTSAVNFVAPGTSGNVLTSDGTTWQSTAPAAGGFSNLTVFASSGTWTVPSGVTKCKVTVVGGGGSGGASDNFDYYAAGGGGGGGTSIGIVTLSGSSATITVGTGGSSVSTVRATGNSGGTSSFVYGATTISATGGGGGTASDAATTIQGGEGGVGSGGSLNIKGQGGGTSTWATGATGVRAGGGSGGSSVYGGGGFGLTNNGANTSPGAGGAYGGGGAGGNSQVSSGAGANGVVFIEY